MNFRWLPTLLLLGGGIFQIFQDNPPTLKLIVYYMPNSFHLIVSISGLGFGHVSKTAPVLNLLHEKDLFAGFGLEVEGYAAFIAIHIQKAHAV